MKIASLICITALAGLAPFLGTPALASTNSARQTATSPTATHRSAITRPVSDTAFAKKAAEANMDEVKLGQLAEQNGANQDVKNFGKRMVEDHTAANDELKTVAEQDKITLPTEINKHDQMVYDNLAKLHGAAFDRAYARDMVRDHQHDVAEFKMEAKDGKNQDVKNFAAKTAPTLEDHLKLAREMVQSVNGTSGGSSAKSY